MKRKDVCIATISLARNSEEERTLRGSLEQLVALDLPVFVTDGGSPAGFIRFLQNLPGFTVFHDKGLWPQAKRSIREAAKTNASLILYTEPDKQEFFSDHLPRILQATNPEDQTGVVLMSRSEQAFAGFPSFQQMTETTINRCCAEVLEKDTDYCYGPFFFRSQLVSQMNDLPDDCGWGWRPFLFARAHHLGYSVENLEGDFYCPEEQRRDDAAERIYRMKQLAQNIDGLVKAAAVCLK